MEAFIENILTILGLGINGTMTDPIDLYLNRLKEFCPNHVINCIYDGKAKKTFQFTNDGDSFYIYYHLNGSRIEKIKVVHC